MRTKPIAIENGFKLETQTFESIGKEMKMAEIELWFNGVPLRITISDTPDYFHAPTEFGKPGKTYQIWGKAVMLTARGDGESGYPHVTGESLMLETEFGNFRIRPVKDSDKKVYGMNNYQGIFMEPVEKAAEPATAERNLSDIVGDKLDDIEDLISIEAVKHEEKGAYTAAMHILNNMRDALIEVLGSVEPEEEEVA